MRKSLKLKIFLSISITVSIIYILAIAVSLLQSRKAMTSHVLLHYRQTTELNAKYLNSIFDKNLEILRAIKNTLNVLSEKPYNHMIEFQNQFIPEIMFDAPQYLSIGVSWEINAIDSTYLKNYGRYRYLYYWTEGKPKLKIDTLNIIDPGIGSLYYKFKISKLDDITDIYYDSYTGLDKDKMLMASIGVPIVKNNKFIGLVAADLSLDEFNNIIMDLKPMPEAHTFMISHTGKIVANSTGKYINKPIEKILGKNTTKTKLLINLQENKQISYIETDSTGNKNLIIIQPFSFGKINKYWGVGIIIPLKLIYQSINQIIKETVFVGILGLLMFILIIILIVNSIVKPLNETKDSLEKISEFDITENYKINNIRKDEIGEIQNSVNQLIESLLSVKEFTSEIAKGNLNYPYKPKSEKDIIGKSLMEMQNSLKEAEKASQERAKEDEIQRWAITGETKITEILRNYSQNSDELFYQITTFIIHYLNALQGAIFLVDNQNKKIILKAAYAQERRKFLKKEVPWGTGLIGRSVIEGETLYITDVPKDYSSISSGLGQDVPKFILIVPFKFNEEIYAVIEINSFKEIKDYEIAFLEKIGVSVASTIANINLTTHTQKLVDEMNIKIKEMDMQREEMKQHIEELQSTQDELLRKVNESQAIISALNQIAFVVEYDMDGKITKVNNKLLLHLNKTREELIGKPIGAFTSDETQKEKLKEIWNSVKKGRIEFFVQKTEIDGITYLFHEAYIPVFDEEGKPIKVINIVNDISSTLK